MTMRVTLVAEQMRRQVPGGIGTYVRGLVKGLAGVAQDRADVTLYASRPHRRPDPLADLGFPLVTASLPGPLLTRAWDRGVAPRLPAGDVVHATSLATPPATATPMTVMVHDLAWRSVPEAYPPHGRRWHEQALARSMTRADVFVVPSRSTADDLVGAGADSAKVEVIPEGCDHLPPADHESAKRLLGRSGVSGPYLLTVSTMEPRKNLTRLMAAFAAVRPKLPEPWPLVVVGPQGWGAAVEPVDGVVLLGRVDDAVLAALYAGARAVAYVPLREGFGLPAVEAMAACVPVVASPIPSTAGAALEVDPLDIDGIAAALLEAVTDERARSELVNAGLRRVSEWTGAAAAGAPLGLWSGRAWG